MSAEDVSKMATQTWSQKRRKAMPKYLVWQERAFVFYQEVEADSKADAIKVAEELGEWEQDQSQSDIVYSYEVDELPAKEEA